MRVLLVKQDHSSPGGLIEDGFAAAGCDVSELVVVPADRYHSPGIAVAFPSPADYDAVAFYGAAWAVYDEATIPWVTDEIAYARSLMSLGVPVLGICFGGQMLAAAVGGTVERAAIPEIGWVTVSTDEPALIEPGPWLAWHFDRFRLPPGVPAIARTALAPQAFAHGRTLGLQFHPEVTDAVLEAWLSNGGDVELAKLGVDTGALIEQARVLADGAAARASRLVRMFVSDIAQRPVAPLRAAVPS